jgi:hypothetical protein
MSFSTNFAFRVSKTCVEQALYNACTLPPLKAGMMKAVV